MQCNAMQCNACIEPKCLVRIAPLRKKLKPNPMLPKYFCKKWLLKGFFTNKSCVYKSNILSKGSLKKTIESLTAVKPEGWWS